MTVFAARYASLQFSRLPRTAQISLAPAILSNALPRFTRTVTVRSARRKLAEASFTGVNEQLDRESRASKLEKAALHKRANAERSPELERAMLEVNSCIKSRDYARALEVFEATPDPDVSLCNTALHACVRGFMFNEAWQIWNMMLDKPPDVVSYSTMIELCARAKRADDAKQLFDEMKAKGISPSIITFNSLMKAFSIAGRLDELQDVFESVRSALLPSASIGNQHTAFSVAMSGFARAGDYARCREIFITMLEMQIQPANNHLNALITACARNGHTDIAQAIFASMAQYNLKPRIDDYTILLSCHNRNLARCIEIYSEVKQMGLTPSSQIQQEMLEAYVLAGDCQGARKFLLEATLLDRGSLKVRRLLKTCSMS